MTIGWIKPGALIRRQAADLLVRVDTDPSVDNLERLERWRASDPRHAEALRKAEAVLSLARLLDPSPAGAGSGPESARPSTWSPNLALAASIAALVFVPVLYLFLEPRFAAVPVQAYMLSTTVGEVRQVSLADGSTVTLDTASAVRVELAKTKRKAVVEHGRARFSIAKHNSPFTVQAGNAAVRMDEGIVDVSRMPAGTQVELIAGTAILSSVDGTIDQEQVRAPAAIHDPATPAQQVDRPQRPGVDWTSGRLSFDGARLADVVASANRYSNPKILIAGPGIGDLRVTGVYKVGNAAGLAQSLAGAFGLRVRRDGAGNFQLQPPSPKP